MSKTRHRYDDEFKKNAVKPSYGSNKTVKEIAGDLGIGVSLLHRWRKKYTPEGEETQFATMEEENQALKLENAELKIERDMLKNCALFRQEPKVKAREKYMFIESHPEYTAAKWARHLDVSLNGYYSWKGKKEQRQKEVDEYKKMIKTIFQESKGTYGIDRICGELRKRGKIAYYHRVKRFMDDMGLHSIHKRRCQRSLTDSRRAGGDEYVNLVKDLEITEPFQVVSSDISYIRTMKGFEYLCTVKDIASGIVLAESMAEHMNSDLVLATIKKALNRWHLPAGTIFHWRHFKTREEVRQAIFAYIEGFITPVGYKKDWTILALYSG